MEQQPKKSHIFHWILSIYTLILAALFVISKVFPTLALLRATVFGTNLPLMLLSIWAWVFLVWIICETKAILGIRFSRTNQVTFFVVLAVLFGYYAFSLITRQFIYYWDYVLYYRMQFGIAVTFQTDGFFSGIMDVIKSVWYNSYSLFNNVLLAAPFALTPKTPNWFVAISAASILPFLYWVIALWIKLLERLLQPKRSELFFIGGMILSAGFPLIHRALLFGQPDLIGLIFVFLIMLLTISYDFSKPDYWRYFFLIVLTIMTCASRRWYQFWLVGYYACYAVYVLLKAVRGKTWINLKRAILFALSAGVILCVVFLPMILVLRKANYAASYSAYNVGGFFGELTSQANYLGIGLLILVFAGLVYGIIRRRSRQLTLFAVLDLLLTIFLFTRIQNMGYHHTLILVPAYLLLMLICLAGICEMESKWMLALSSVVVLGFSAVNASVCATSSTERLPTVFSNAALIPPQRTDIKQIRAINQWLLEHCTKSDPAYMIPHGYPYNPDVFRSCDYPDASVSQVLPYGSAVLGTHYFPDGLLLSKYVLTCEPFCDLSLAGKYNSTFLSEIPQKHFTEITHFDMGNGYVFFVYERIKPTDREEILFYEDCFSEENKLFPELFSGVWDELLKQVG
ncbi:MAG: hypothetical protein ABFC56_14055 [Clostridiaceae bacterium]